MFINQFLLELSELLLFHVRLFITFTKSLDGTLPHPEQALQRQAQAAYSSSDL